MKKILYIVNSLDFFLSHRLPVAIAAKKKGFDVHIAGKSNSNDLIKLKKYGFRVYSLSIFRKSVNLQREIKLFLEIFNLIRCCKPQIVNLITIKPIIYGGICCRILKIPLVLFSISGLGHVYHSHKKILKKFLIFLFKFSSNHKKCFFILQNKSDLKFLKNKKIINKKNYIFTKGSGVNLNIFKPKKKIHQKDVIITLISRMVFEKGILDFVEASKKYLNIDKKVKFLLVGKHDFESPSSIPINILKSYNNKKIYPNLSWLGEKKDIKGIIHKSTIIVLASYHEGCPKVLLEAAACGKAIIATNIAGSREVVINNKNGILIKKNCPNDIVNSIKKILLNPAILNKMKKYSILKSKKEFSVDIVVQKNLEVYNNLTSK